MKMPAAAALRRATYLLTIGAFAALSMGCAEQTIKRQSQEAMVAGDYEKAVTELEAGLKRFPESPLLRSGLVQAREVAIARMFASAATLSSDGKLDEAVRELARAKVLDPRNTRIDVLLSDLETQRRQQAALLEAEQRVARHELEAALRIVEEGLKENPRHPGLLALRRRAELELRQTRSATGRPALAETRPVSLDFRDANLRTVLDVVSRNSGISFILDRDIRPETRVTVFLRQARVEDALDLIIGTNQLAKKVVDAQTIVIYPNTAEKQREYQEQIVRVFYLASAEAKGAAAFLRAMIKTREPFVDERSNMLALRDSQENIQLAERLIALYDAGEPEVLLDVEVIEVSTSRLTELGLKFPNSFSLTPLAPAGTSGLTLGNIGGLNRDRVGLGVSGLLVNLRREVGDFTTLANPRIRARNKEKAKILIGDKIPVITTTTGTGGFVSDSVNYLDVGLKLDVEPTVYADDEVAIKFALEVSTLGSAVKTNSGTLAYQIGTRNASTLLRLRDGETQLLAGLISKEDRTSASRVPGVGDLPVLGRLFSSQQDSDQRTELVLAITPRILRNIRRPDANETELWVGTDALPRLRLPRSVAVETTPSPPTAAAGTTTMPTEASPAPSSPSKERSPGAPSPGPGLVNLQWQGPAETSVGQTVELILRLESSTALRGIPLVIGFDRQRLQWIDGIEGDIFKRDGNATSFAQSVDAANGKVRIGVLRNQTIGVAGNGTVVALRFKAIAPGAAAVRVERAEPVYVDGLRPNLGPEAVWTVQVR